MMVNPSQDLCFWMAGNIRIHCKFGQQSRKMKLICFQVEANRNVGRLPVAHAFPCRGTTTRLGGG
jgi:hypothetical protein